MSVKLMHGDCLELMETLPDASVDMILCDLPYGTTACKWDTVIPFEPLWAQYRRIAKRNAAIVLTAAMPFAAALLMSNPKEFRYEWVWHKNRATGHLDAKKRPMRCHENILVFGKKLPDYVPQKTLGHKAAGLTTRATNNNVYGKEGRPNTWGATTERYPRDVQGFDCVNNDDPDRSHPTQKPVALMEYMIRTYTNEGDTVMDNCMGSGTTGVACLNTGRNFIGIERDAGYFQIASSRIENAQSQARLDL
jgi:DNA modification methylase